MPPESIEQTPTIWTEEQRQALVDRINSGDGGTRGRPVLSAHLEREALNEEERTVPASFSSETKVRRWWGIEILDHAPESVDLSMVRDGKLPLLASHDIYELPRPGNIEDFRIVGKKTRGILRFAKHARAEELWQAVKDGFLDATSIGYRVIDALPEGVDKKSGLTIFRCTWSPVEGSLANIGSDGAVGIGRSVEGVSVLADQRVGAGRGDQDQPTATAIGRKEGIMPPEVEKTTVAAAPETPAKPPASAPSEVREDPAIVERKRVQDIAALGNLWPKRGGPELATEFVKSGRSLEDFRAVLIERLAAQPDPPFRPAGSPDLGLGDIERQEHRRFSIWNMIRAIAFPDNADFQEKAKFEREVCGAYSAKNGRVSQNDGGFMIPGEALQRRAAERLARRDIQILSPGTGGYMVQTDVPVNEFIELLRNNAPIMQLCRVIGGLVGNVSIPKKTAGGTAYWVNEVTAPTESNLTLGPITLQPKTVGGYTDVTRLMMLQTSGDMEALVVDDLTETVGIDIDRVGIKGGGSGEPSGILTLPSGIGNVNMGDNAGAPTWAKIVEFLSTTGQANAIRGDKMSWLTNWKVAGTLMSTMKTTTYGDVPIWNEANANRPLANFPVSLTANVPSNYAKGTHTATDLSALIFGNFNDLVIGLWDGLDIARDTSAGFLTGAVRIRVLQTLDVALRIASSFTISDEIITI